MEVLQLYDIDPDVPHSELMDSLRVLPSATLKFLRSELFDSAKKKNLVDPDDILVNRNHSATNPLEKKLAEDILRLINCVSNDTQVQRTLLRNGKRSRDAFEMSRLTQTQSQPANPINSMPVSIDLAIPTPLPPSANPMPPSQPPAPPKHIVGNSIVMRELNCIKGELQSIKTDVRQLQKSMQAVPATPPNPPLSHLPAFQGTTPIRALQI